MGISLTECVSLLFRLVSMQLVLYKVVGEFLITDSIAKAPVFELLRGQFWGFSLRVVTRWTDGPLLHAKFHRHRCKHGVGLRRPTEHQKLKKWLTFYKISEYIPLSHGRISYAIFTKFAEFVARSKMRQLLKFGWNRWMGYRILGR